MKTCTVCKKELPLTDYHKSSVSKDSFSYRCKSCDKKARMKYREENSEKFYMNARKRALKFKYGITLEEYEKVLAEQKGLCACCGVDKNATGGSREYWNFAVDHCHETGEIRGLLCNACNRGIGLLGDTAENLQRAVDYLRKETH